MSAKQQDDALRERDAILADLDVEAAKTFLLEHGGAVPQRGVDWTRVLHLARAEVTSLPDDLIEESRIYLAQHGTQTVMSLPPGSPYLRLSLDLIFPRDVFDAFMAAQGETT